MKGGSSKGHAARNSPEYRAWGRMRERCNNPNHQAYARYGGRGIKVCARWNSFLAFFDDMGRRPEGKQLERRDNDGHYELENCYWATIREQANNRHNTRYLTLADETDTAANWARRLDIPFQTLWSRLRNGWSDERALTTPIDERYSRHC